MGNNDGGVNLLGLSGRNLTILPALQFTLAGVIGNPTKFYEVPAIRFAYDLLSYL